MVDTNIENSTERVPKDIHRTGAKKSAEKPSEKGQQLSNIAEQSTPKVNESRDSTKEKVRH